MEIYQVDITQHYVKKEIHGIIMMIVDILRKRRLM